MACRSGSWYIDFGIGGAPNLIGVKSVDLPVKGANGHPAFARIPWKTPSTPGHYCIRVQLTWSNDANPLNNLGQENTDVKPLNSPHALFAIPVRNDGRAARTVRIEADFYERPAAVPCQEKPARQPALSMQEIAVNRRAALARHGREHFGVPADWRVEVQPGQLRSTPVKKEMSLSISRHLMALPAVRRSTSTPSTEISSRAASPFTWSKRYGGSSIHDLRPAPGLRAAESPGGSMSTWGDIYSIVSGGGLGLLKRICQYLLHGKLVCLGGDRCAIGRMAAFNTVDDKSGFEKLDNDFGIRIVLCPTSLSSMLRGKENRVANHKTAIAGPQGELLEERFNMPMPHNPGSPDEQPSAKFKGVDVEFDFTNFGPPVVAPTSADAPFLVPVLHCEIEGDRIPTVCAALSIFSNPVVDAFCSIPLIGWAPLVDHSLLAPLITSVFATAWAAGSNDSRDFDNAGSLAEGDTVVITGRWVFDAGHEGGNELHPVKACRRSTRIFATLAISKIT